MDTEELSADRWRDMFAGYMLFVEEFTGRDWIDEIGLRFGLREREAIAKIKADRTTWSSDD